MSANFNNFCYRNLKSLEIDGYNDFRSNGEILVNCKSLESLTVRLKKIASQQTSEAIRKTLIDNKKLKKLEIFGDLLHPVFDRDLTSEKNFSLTELNIDFLMHKSNVCHNLNLLLMMQRNSLEILSIKRSCGVEVMKTILSLPRLKQLTLGEGDIMLIRKNNCFEESHSVTSLHLKNSPFLLCNFNILLKLFPKVETLKVQTFTEELANAISKTCKSLKTLSIDEFVAIRIKDEAFFMKLKKLKCNSLSTASYSLFGFLTGQQTFSFD